MGQKINPNIFRLGITKTWKTQFFEKKSRELPLYTFKDLEIKNYIERFFGMQGIILHDYKLHYSDSSLNLYISYFVTSKFNENKLDKKKSIKNFLTAKYRGNNMQTIVSSTNFYKVKKYLKSDYSYHLQLLKKSTVSVAKFSILQQILKVLSLFLENKFDIVINFCCINKDLNFLKFLQIKKLTMLQKFRNTLFYKEGIELLFYVFSSTNSASLLAKFVALQIKKIKRQKFFFSFLKQTLIVLRSSHFSKVKGIKIIIKGRLNGLPRAKYRTVSVGDIPIQSISENLDYSQTTIHNHNGSYGVKVWILER